MSAAEGWCMRCDGDGWVWIEPHPLDTRSRATKVLCPLCRGTGEESFDCVVCGTYGARYQGADGFAYCSDLCEAERLERDGEEARSLRPGAS